MKFLMRMGVWLAFVLLLVLAYNGHAQAPVQPPSSAEQAIGQKLMEEINEGLRLRAQVIGLQEQVRQLQDELAKRPLVPPAEPPKP